VLDSDEVASRAAAGERPSVGLREEVAMRVAGLLGIALLFAALAFILGLRASNNLKTIIDPLPAVLLSAASIGAVAIKLRPTQPSRPFVLATVVAVVFVALQGAAFIALHIRFFVNGSTPRLQTLLLGASYLLGATFVLANLRITIKLQTQPHP
jgi:hypothetical protein